MSDTPPVRQEFGRSARHIGYFYSSQASGSLEYSPPFFGTDQPNAIGPYGSAIDPSVDGHNRGYRAETSSSSRNDIRLMRTPEDEGMNRR